ncbi:PHP domain-containing protein [Acidiferrobacter sp.]|uniref:PHP domain-containing protein n=1 Tax=Acidiferrobacter sp. TaxID=1872107 RepID=UPI0026296D6F|nr:PHP domain-containing protein [Acidiferrobacter sp.]
MYYDLHTHTVWSDGDLEPASLVADASAAGVRVLALTDHDTMAGIDEAARAAHVHGIQFIPGVELSVTWAGGVTVHVVGLGVDGANAQLRQALENLREARLKRGRAMVEALSAAGLGGAQSVLERPGIVSRVHVADWLVACGHAPDRARAFKRFLVRGAPGHVAVQWPDIGVAVDWIRGAGGCPVLAHPSRYRLSGGRLEQLVRAFVEAGGLALEVVTAGLDAGEIGRLARLARRHALHASVGSDFHKALPWRLRPGGLPELPGDCRPVWERWPAIRLQGAD